MWAALEPGSGAGAEQKAEVMNDDDHDSDDDHNHDDKQDIGESERPTNKLG